MMWYTIINADRDTVLANNAQKARTFYARLRGLMFRKCMEKGEGLIFSNAPSIHTFFMRFPIDIIFLDKEGRILKIYEARKPYRFSGCFRSPLTIELPAHTVSKTATQSGDMLRIEPRQG